MRSRIQEERWKFIHAEKKIQQNCAHCTVCNSLLETYSALIKNKTILPSSILEGNSSELIEEGKAFPKEVTGQDGEFDALGWGRSFEGLVKGCIQQRIHRLLWVHPLGF